MLWRQVSKLEVPPKFISILREPHDWMQARVLAGELQSQYFKVNVVVKQGCVLASVLFNLLLSAVTHLFHHDLGDNDSVQMEYHLDESLFNIWRLQAHTKMKTCHIYELQYTDDCAILVHTPESLQKAVDTISSLYRSFGLQVNTDKTQVMSQLISQTSSTPPFPHQWCAAQNS